MKGIGGNIEAWFQVATITENAIGEQVKNWQNVQRLKGWLDLSSGGAKYTSFHAKIQESTHVFVADYTALDQRIDAETARMVIAGKAYDITLIDNPMELKHCSQLEIYLKYTGGV